MQKLVAQITAKAMAKAREDRFQSAQAMAQVLETADRYTTDPLSSSPPSYYGPQSPPPYTHAAANPPQPSNYGMTPPYGSSPHITNPTVARLSNPAFQPPVGKASITYIALAI